jgi:uncharacterized membrane protein YphA (DoxX/SURF4 family)
MFPNGWPGRGLLLLRAANGLFVIHESLPTLLGSQQFSPFMATAALAGALLLAGIWTPIMGVLLAALEIGMVFRGSNRPEETILSIVIALSIAMLGPGVWSVDAVVFGRQRLEFPEN